MVSAKPQATPTPSQKPNQARPIEKKWTNRFTFKKHSVSEIHEGYCPYELSADYPEALSHRSSVKRFNRWIKRKILADVKRFRGLELKAEPRQKKEGRRAVTEGLELGYEVYFSNRELISLRFTHRVMAAGQMHPINYYETINFDLQRQRPLVARDVFRRGYLKVVSRYSRKYLLDTYDIQDDSWFHNGTAPRAVNFPNWNLVPDGALISFEDYQVNAHSFGQPELVVPYSKLRRVLKTGLYRRLMKG